MAKPPRTLSTALTCFGALACGKAVELPSDPLVIQAAAVAFLVRANSDATACVQVASGPNELAGNRVAGQLQDAPTRLIVQLKGRGVAVRAFSACSLEERKKVTYAIGWPRRTERDIQINADRLCGSRCGEGSLLVVKQVGTEWRATEGATTWMS
jgi:hypothetical protein